MIPKTKFLSHPLLLFLFFLIGNSAVSQINLGSIEDFALFTSNGAISNTATSDISGDIGTNLGAISGFSPPTVVNGSFENTNSITAQAVLDLEAIVTQINNTVTTTAHAPVFGSETLTPGIYSQPAAASLLGTLTLDAEGDPNAEFIFKIGGAFSTAAGSTVLLINCASPDNIFWLSGGAISMAASTSISGNLISNPGAVSIGSGGKVDGRMLSTTGAISVYATKTNNGLSGIDSITQPTCSIPTGSFQIRNYDATATYTFAPSVISISDTGLVTVNSNTYTMTSTTIVGGCSSSASTVTVVINPAPTKNYWIGATSSDWNIAANWSCGVPSILNDLINIIPEVTTSYPIIASEPDNSGLVKNLEIKISASLTIINNSLRLTNSLTLDGKIYLKEESQLLQDTGSVFDLASTGSIEINQQGTGNSFRYNYWGSPVNSGGANFIIGDVLRDGTDPNNSIEIDFGPNISYADGTPSLPIKISTRWMYKLEDSGLGYSAWASVGNSEDVKVGQGYSMKGSNTIADEQNYTFVGKPNNGIIELTVGANNDHLAGNPYPSAIDADKFIDDNGLFPGTGSITGTLYFWDHYAGDNHVLAAYPAGYATYSKSGGVPASSIQNDERINTSDYTTKGAPKKYIPVAQGFFVVGDADGGQVQFNNSQRVFVKESSGNSVFMRTNPSESTTTYNSENDLRPKFRIGFDAPKISHRQVLLTLDPNTSDAIDWGYDAEMYEFFDDDMYWVLNDKKYVIQATNEFGFDKEIPIGVRTMDGGLIRIKVDALEHAEDYSTIYIKDRLTGEIHDISNQAFEINLDAGEYHNRFFLVLQPRVLTIEEETLVDEVYITMNNSISELQLKSTVDTDIRNVSLYNNIGQQVKTWNINKTERSISIPLHVASGMYIVIAKTTTGTVNKKIIVTNCCF
ncbi:ice-binding family protein [Bizionia arctica]|uniref:DUF3494 domain-containing protein n=1 Tax=Bizionia arctica TaxID=1495645 RepID=A0A917GLF8_9FLAO|nr:ice-binding family protein [Bizionia arctica]GGG50904.1 hypothetical protein GCM10010976_22590 [Bizionia arctica]